MTIGYVFKAQYFLPYNESHLYPSRLSRDIKDDEYEQQQQQFQNNDYEIEIDHEKTLTDDYTAAENEEENEDSVRWSIYRAMDIFLRRQMKIDGKQCILRAICEATQLPIAHDGLLGELLHILLV